MCMFISCFGLIVVCVVVLCVLCVVYSEFFFLHAVAMAVLHFVWFVSELHMFGV